MTTLKKGTLFIIFFGSFIANAQTLPAGLDLKGILGGTFTMGSNSLMGSPNQQVGAPEHEVTVSTFSMSESEVTNSQYVEFLNSAVTQ